jgi:hypothetical protein
VTEKAPPRKPDFVVKIRVGEGDDGKLERVGGMWKRDRGEGFYICLDDGITLTSTEQERIKLFALVNDWDEKHPEEAAEKKARKAAESK